MSQHFFKDKAVERYDLQKSKLLTPFGCQDRMKNFKANLQPKYSCQRKTMLLAFAGEFTTRMCKVLGYLPEIAFGWIAVRCSIWIPAARSGARSRPLNKNYPVKN